MRWMSAFRCCPPGASRQRPFPDTWTARCTAPAPPRRSLLFDRFSIQMMHSRPITTSQCCWMRPWPRHRALLRFKAPWGKLARRWAAARTPAAVMIYSRTPRPVTLADVAAAALDPCLTTEGAIAPCPRRLRSVSFRSGAIAHEQWKVVKSAHMRSVQCWMQHPLPAAPARETQPAGKDPRR